MAESTRYYSFRYSTISCIISKFLCDRYNISPVNLQSHCDRCGTAFVVTHILSCSIGGLVIARHNGIRDKLLYLSGRAFTSACVRAKTLIHQGRTRSEKEICQGSDKHKYTRGYVIIWGSWDIQVNDIIDVKLVDMDAEMYKYEPMKSLITRWEKIKKYKHSKHYNDHRKHFSSFVLSVDRMLLR